MPVPRQVTKEFFIPDEFSIFEPEVDEHIIDELPQPTSLANNHGQIDSLLYLFDLLEESFNRTNNANDNQENVENPAIENKEFDENEIFNDNFENDIYDSDENIPRIDAYQQAIHDLDELENLLTELYTLTSGRGTDTNENSQQALHVIDDDG